MAVEGGRKERRSAEREGGGVGELELVKRTAPRSLPRRSRVEAARNWVRRSSSDGGRGGSTSKRKGEKEKKEGRVWGELSGKKEKAQPLPTSSPPPSLPFPLRSTISSLLPCHERARAKGTYERIANRGGKTCMGSCGGKKDNLKISTSSTSFSSFAFFLFLATARQQRRNKTSTREPQPSTSLAPKSKRKAEHRGGGGEEIGGLKALRNVSRARYRLSTTSQARSIKIRSTSSTTSLAPRGVERAACPP